MIIVMSQEATENDIKGVTDRVAEYGLRTHLSQGEERTIIAVSYTHLRAHET